MRRDHMKTSLAVGLAALLAVAIAGCSGGASSGGSTSGGTSAGRVTITEQNLAFSPSTATVKVGDTVTFTNSDSVTHDVKIDNVELGSQNPNESKMWTASKAGTLTYRCLIHPQMVGQITAK